jgi:fucose permease
LRGWVRGWSGPIVILGSLAFCLTLAEGGALDWGAVYLRDTLDAGSGTAAAGVAAFLGAMTIGRLAGDRLIARIGPKATLRLGALIAGPGFGFALFLDMPVAGVGGLLLLGLGLSCLLPLIISAAGSLSGQSAASAVSRVSTLGYLGSFVGPALIGSVAGLTNLGAALAVAAALVAATALGGRAVSPHVRR